MSRLLPPTNLSTSWTTARSQITRILSDHAAAVNARLQGDDAGATGSATASFVASNKPGGNNKTSPDTWVAINLNGTVYYIPAFLP